MSCKERHKLLRKIRRRELYEKNKEIKLLTLHIMREYEAKRRADAGDVKKKDITQYDDLTNFIIKFKNKLSDYPSSSIDNRCLPKNYIYSVKNRYPRRRRSGSGYNH